MLSFCKTHVSTPYKNKLGFAFNKLKKFSPAETPNSAPTLNPNSLIQKKNCLVEPFLKKSKPGNTFQFERLGYFCKDTDSSQNNPVFNRTIELRDTWSKLKPGNIS